MRQCFGIDISHLNGVPILARERVDGLLLEALLALGESLVPGLRLVCRIEDGLINSYFPTAMIATKCNEQLEKSKMQTMRWRGRIISISCVHQFRPKRAHNNQVRLSCLSGPTRFFRKFLKRALCVSRDLFLSPVEASPTEGGTQATL